MSNHDDRRQFSRLEMSEAAVAVDETGFQFGRVLEVSGGGLQIDAASKEAIDRLPKGARLTITIVEPGSATANSINVEVRHVNGSLIGLMFV